MVRRNSKTREKETKSRSEPPWFGAQTSPRQDPTTPVFRRRRLTRIHKKSKSQCSINNFNKYMSQLQWHDDKRLNPKTQ